MKATIVEPRRETVSRSDAPAARVLCEALEYETAAAKVDQTRESGIRCRRVDANRNPPARSRHGAIDDAMHRLLRAGEFWRQRHPPRLDRRHLVQRCAAHRRELIQECLALQV